MAAIAPSRPLPPIGATLLCLERGSTSAYPREGRGGYRDSAGPCRVETTAGPRKVGCEMDQQAIETIHRNRRQLALAGVQYTAEQVRQVKAIKGATLQEAVAGLLPTMPGSL